LLRVGHDCNKFMLYTDSLLIHGVGFKQLSVKQLPNWQMLMVLEAFYCRSRFQARDDVHIDTCKNTVVNMVL
jgi:hypothetical protein